MLARKILDWTQEKFDEIDYEKDKHPSLKAFGCGAVEGIIDGMLMSLPIALFGMGIWKKVAEGLMPKE